MGWLVERLVIMTPAIIFLGIDFCGLVKWYYYRRYVFGGLAIVIPGGLGLLAWKVLSTPKSQTTPQIEGSVNTVNIQSRVTRLQEQQEDRDKSYT